MGIQEFVRRLKMKMGNADSRFVFFIGSGCSATSGIPSSSTLVKQWLLKLQNLQTGENSNFEKWLKEKDPKINSKNLAEFYGETIEEVFTTQEERQQEIERLTQEKDPGFGYATLSQLISDKNFGHHFNIVLTTNFDDLIADALYLYTNTKPLIISHESLAGFVRVSRTRPLIIKLHGDAKLAPKNTILETDELNDQVKNILKNLLSETGLIFLGYNGLDNSIVKILQELDEHTLPWGVYWVNEHQSQGNMKEWLDSKNSVWVQHKDFDELMLLLKNEFGLPEPDKTRFDKLLNTYSNTFESLQEKIELKPLVEKEKYEKAIEKITSDDNYSSLISRAKKLEKIDIKEAEQIYKKLVTKFPSNIYALGEYAYFLAHTVRKFEEAEKYYKKCFKINPNSISTLDYAYFLTVIKNNLEKPKELYERMVKSATHIARSDYAIFLDRFVKDFEKAEKYYKESLEMGSSISYGNYASFLIRRRNNLEEAKIQYETGKSIQESVALKLTYADALLSIGDVKGFKILNEIKRSSEKNLKIGMNIIKYSYVKDRRVQKHSLKELKRMLNKGDSGYGYIPSDLEFALKNHHNPELLRMLNQVLFFGKETSNLSKFPEWEKIKI